MVPASGESVQVNDDTVWVLSNDWRGAVSRIGLGAKVARSYFSVFNCSVGESSILGAFWSRWFGALPETTRLLTHHPMARRYLIEMAGISSKNIAAAPLPFMPLFSQKKAQSGRFPTVGVVGNFDAQANLHFLVLVAHRLISRTPTLRFRMLGNGRFRAHLERMAEDLSIASNLEIQSSVGVADIIELDACVFAPLRCDHFASLLVAAANQVPTLCMQTPGLDELLGGLAVPITPVYQTQALSRAVEKVLFDLPSRAHHLQAMCSGFEQRLSWNGVSKVYEQVFGLTGALMSRHVAA